MHLNDNIAQCIGKPRKRGQKFGIELEYENHGGKPFDGQHWELQRDGSLRNNGVEFVSNPLKYPDLLPALKEVEEFFDAEECELDPNERCGMHVHLNMLDYSWANLFSLSALYTLLEPTIFAKYAPERLDNHFCVPTFMNTALVDMMLEDVMKLRAGKPWMPPEPPPEPEANKLDPVDQARQDMRLARHYGLRQRRVQQLRQEEPRRHADMLVAYELEGGVAPRRARVQPAPQFNAGIMPRANAILRILGASKYCAMNYSRLNEIGTVEFRMAPATADMGEVREWVEFLKGLQLLANEYDDPLQIVEEYEQNGLRALCKKAGIVPQQVDRIHQDDAEDAATFMAGYIPPQWEDLAWEIPAEQEVA